MGNAKSCLLIDDDHDDQLVFNIIIERLNRPVVCITADNALEGLKKLEEDPGFTPDSIFLDLNMPGVGGLEFLTAIKSNSRLAGIPVIVYTTSSREEDVVHAKQLGAAAYIVKSFDIPNISRRISEFL